MPTEKLIKDLTRPLDQYCYIKEDETVQEALRLMDKAREESKHLCLVVVGTGASDKEIIKGFVTPAELVFGLSANFLKGAQRSGPIFWEGQLEAECMEGVKKRVREIMVPIRACVRATELLMEAVFLLNKYQIDFLPTVSKEEVVGIIHIYDILTHIAKLASGEQSRSKVRAFHK